MPRNLSINFTSPGFKLKSPKTKVNPLKFDTDDKLIDHVLVLLFNLIPSFNKYLSQRPHSHSEVKDYLKSKFDKLQISVSDEAFFGKLVDYLIQEKILNQEADFIRFWLISRSSSTPRSLYGIKYELRSKGVNANLIDRIVQEMAGQGKYDEIEALRKLYQRYKTKPWPKFKQAAIRHRFKFETIKRLENELAN